jgi:peptide-N4-(N-acetyl-beta-glucosaminyl)asparagine amidase
MQRIHQYEESSVQEKILSLLPLEKIEKEANENLKKQEIELELEQAKAKEQDGLQKLPQKEKNITLSYRDFLVKSLLYWFKYNFFTWCNQPKCQNCDIIAEKYIRQDSPSFEESKFLASRTEVYQCPNCQKEIRFPRYNDPRKLCETKTGRCGEWANLFGAILRAFNFDVRFVDNFEDHVWNEYYSEHLKKWVHVDSCENAFDTPLVYEQGWGREMTVVLGHSIHGVQDCTARYVKDFEFVKKKRSPDTINNLKSHIEKINKEKRFILTENERNYLANRDKEENEFFMKIDFIKKVINKEELIERQSGSDAWRKERGEMKN